MTFESFRFNNDMLVQLRKDKGLTRSEFARQTCIEESQICRLENGQTKDPLLETVFVFAKFFNVEMETFKSGSAL